MRRRSGITLVEVLVALFIMGIGMIALLALFPLGALNVAQALRDDRAAQAAANADTLATARNLRLDPMIEQEFAAELNDVDPAFRSVGPSSPLFVDPARTQFGDVRLGTSNTPLTPGIRRVSPSYVNDAPLPDDGSTAATRATYFFSLLDDLNFDPNGTPTRDAGNAIQRGGRFSWAYLLRRPRADSDAVVEMSVVVFFNRSASLSTIETTYTATGKIGTNSVTIDYGSQNQAKPQLRSGGWILDTTRDATGVVRGYFYRVVSVEDIGATSVLLELGSPLKAGLNVSPAAVPDKLAIVVLDNLLEVIERGTGH